MSRTLARWMPVFILSFLPISNIVVAGAGPSSAPMLGFTPTTTVTATATATATATVPATVTATATRMERVCIPVITKRCEPAVAARGEEVTCIIVVKNEGEEKAENAHIIDDMPDYLDILDVVVDPAGQVRKQELNGQELDLDVGTIGRWNGDGKPFEVKVIVHARVREDAPQPVCVENLAEFRADNCPDRAAAVLCTLPETGGTGIWWTAAGGLGTVVLVLGLLLAKRERL